MTKRILALCHEYPPIGGGAGAACAALCEEYSRQGHEVVVFTMGFGDLPDGETINGVRVQRIRSGRKRKEMTSAIEALWWARVCWRQVRQEHQRQPFDATHAHFIMPSGLIGMWLARAGGVPFIITPHGSDVPGHNRERLKLAHVLARPWWRDICRRTNMICCPSENIHGLLCSYVDRVNSMVIPNGLDVSRFRPGKKEKRILLCSRLIEQKGFQYFLEAIQDIELPGWHIDIVGDGPMYDRIAKLANSCRTEVTMHGWVDNRDPKLANLYARSMIFVFPSERENLPVSLMEAMSAGCAIITTEASGNPEVIGKTGLLTEAKDREGLRRATLELTSDFDLCRQMGLSAAERVAERFNLPMIAGRYLQTLAVAESSVLKEEQKCKATSVEVGTTK